jgi:uncharacterized protein
LKLTLETSDVNLIRAWEPDAIRVGDEWLQQHLIVAADRIILDWQPPPPGQLSLADLEAAISLEPEIILLGTGAKLTTPDVALMAQVAASGIGLEIMDTPAACRTYNVLTHESRRVVAALFIEPSTT